MLTVPCSQVGLAAACIMQVHHVDPNDFDLRFQPGMAVPCPRNVYALRGCFGTNDSQAGQRWSSIDHDPLPLTILLSFPATLGADGMINPVATIRPHPMTPIDLREVPVSLIPEHQMREP
jgi:hypothetical protein